MTARASSLLGDGNIIVGFAVRIYVLLWNSC